MGKSHNIGRNVHGFEPQMRIMINEPTTQKHVKTTSGQRDTGAYHHIPELLEVFFGQNLNVSNPIPCIYIYMGSGRFPGPMELLQQLVRVSKTR